MKVIKDICKLLREESLCKYAWFEEVCSHVLNVYSRRIVRVLWEEEAPVAKGPGQEDIVTQPDSYTEDESASIDFEDKQVSESVERALTLTNSLAWSHYIDSVSLCQIYEPD